MGGFYGMGVYVDGLSTTTRGHLDIFKRGIFTYFHFNFSVLISLTCENVFFFHTIFLILGFGMGMGMDG